jgi:ABC-type Fe3+ transport system permease subunit
VGGFVTSIVAAALMLMSFGFLAFVSVIAAPFGIFYSRKGKQAVDEGKTRKHRGLAQAGFVIGIVTFVISAIVSILLIIFIIALATDEEFREDFENDGGFDSTTVSAGALAVRVAAAAIGIVA